MRRLTSGLLVALIMLVGAAGPVCAQLVIDGETISDAKTFDAAKKEAALVAYGIYPVEQMTAILKAFQADTGITTEFVRLPTPNLFNRVTTEFAANKLDADYLDIADQTVINQLVERGVYAPHKVPTFDRIPAALKEPQGRYYTVLRVISTAIVVNMSRVKEADVPKTLSDILDPKWKGVLGITSINAGGSAFTMDAFLREKLGNDYGQRMAALSPKIYPFIAPLVTDITRGEIALAVGAISEPILSQMKAGAPLKMVFPPEGVGSFPTVAGVTSTAKHPNAAALLIDWMTSKRGGQVIVKGGAYALHPDAGSPSSDLVTYLPSDKVWNIDTTKWLAEREARMAEWRQIFGAN
jgi:iron(III) transport system substrate-binding protein